MGADDLPPIIQPIQLPPYWPGVIDLDDGRSILAMSDEEAARAARLLIREALEAVERGEVAAPPGLVERWREIVAADAIGGNDGAEAAKVLRAIVAELRFPPRVEAFLSGYAAALDQREQGTH